MASEPLPQGPPVTQLPRYETTLAARRRSYGPNTALSYERPIMIVRGQGTYLYDEQGVSYLDCVNNVSHVGHGNPEVAAAISSQLHTLNTNSRYLHPDLAVYSDMLLRTLNDGGSSGGGGGGGGGITSSSSSGAGVACCSRPALEAVAKAASSSLQHSCCSSSNSSNSSGSSNSNGSTRQQSQHQPSPPLAATASSDISDNSNKSINSDDGPSLEVLYLVCSGSEANDLALRIATAAAAAAACRTTIPTAPTTTTPPATPPTPPVPLHVAVMAGAYHGHLSSLIPLSPYKFWGTGGGGRPPHVHVVPCPDPYRGENLDGRAAAESVLEAARRAGGRLAAFFCESILSCGGQIVPPPEYMRDLYSVLRAAGVVLVADEVQCGFGRCGTAFWGFQALGLRPDIVTMGKPIGNGYPLAALATSRRLASTFAASGMEYFNTYGGSTAAVAAGLAVLRILQRDGLQQHAQQVGHYLLSGLRRLQQQHDALGDVRGMGLFLGVEVVRDRGSKRHAPVTARWIKERMKARHVLLSTDGPYDNVIKIKPPLVFGFREADRLLEQLSVVLSQELTCDIRQDLIRQEDERWATVMAPRQRQYEANRRQLATLLPPPLAGGAAAATAAAATAAAATAAAAVVAPTQPTGSGDRWLQSRL